MPPTGHQAVSIKQRVFSCFSSNYFIQISYNEELRLSESIDFEELKS